MSLLKCDFCGSLINTDDCPHAYNETLDKWLCDLCHSEWFDDQEDERSPEDRYR